LAALVEAGREVHEEDHGDREQAQGADHEAEVAPLPHQRQEAENARSDANRDQQVGVGGASGPRFHRRGVGDLGEARIAGLPDLDRAVVDELRGGEADAGSDQEHRRGSSRGDDLAGGGRQAHQ
jgi:hypothetical protein